MCDHISTAEATAILETSASRCTVYTGTFKVHKYLNIQVHKYKQCATTFKHHRGKCNLGPKSSACFTSTLNVRNLTRFTWAA